MSCQKELIMLHAKGLLDDVLSANYPGKYLITRNAAKDPKTIPPGMVAAYMIEGASSPEEQQNSTNYYRETFRLDISLRIGYPEASNIQGEQLSSMMNEAEALIKIPFRSKTYLVNSRQVLYEINSTEREVGLNVIWQLLSLSITYITD